MKVWNARQDCVHDGVLLKAGENEVPDKVAVRLLEAGKYTGDFLPVRGQEVPSAPIATALDAGVEEIPKPRLAGRRS